MNLLRRIPGDRLRGVLVVLEKLCTFVRTAEKQKQVKRAGLKLSAE